MTTILSRPPAILRLSPVKVKSRFLKGAVIHFTSVNGTIVTFCSVEVQCKFVVVKVQSDTLSEKIYSSGVK